MTRLFAGLRARGAGRALALTCAFLCSVTSTPENALATSDATASGGGANLAGAAPVAGDGFVEAVELMDATELAEASVKPHWCNATGSLVDDIHRLGGESVMRVELGDGRTLERYWNVNEEVTIEHGTDGNSCLLELKLREAGD